MWKLRSVVNRNNCSNSGTRTRTDIPVQGIFSLHLLLYKPTNLYLLLQWSQEQNSRCSPDYDKVGPLFSLNYPPSSLRSVRYESYIFDPSVIVAEYYLNHFITILEILQVREIFTTLFNERYRLKP